MSLGLTLTLLLCHLSRVRGGTTGCTLTSSGPGCSNGRTGLLYLHVTPFIEFVCNVNVCVDQDVDVRNFVNIGGLSYLVVATSSHCENMRKAAYSCLDLFMEHFSASKFREKHQVMY